MAIKYLFYFFFGGIIVSTVTYFASHAKGLFAAFVANLPVITLITFFTIYLESGQKEVISYAYGLLIMLVPWLAYIFAIIFLTPRIGFFPSILLGVFLYLIGAYLLINFRRF